MTRSENNTPDTPAIVRELEPAPDPEVCFQRLAGKPYCLFLDSAQRRAELGR